MFFFGGCRRCLWVFAGRRRLNVCGTRRGRLGIGERGADAVLVGGGKACLRPRGRPGVDEVVKALPDVRGNPLRALLQLSTSSIRRMLVCFGNGGNVEDTKKAASSDVVLDECTVQCQDGIGGMYVNISRNRITTFREKRPKRASASSFGDRGPCAIPWNLLTPTSSTLKKVFLTFAEHIYWQSTLKNENSSPPSPAVEPTASFAFGTPTRRLSSRQT